MPDKPLRPCKKVGCRNITRSGYCEDHISLDNDDKAYRNARYDNSRRNRQSDAFYHSREWKGLQAYVITKYNGIDLFSYYVEGKIEYATTGHHIVEISEDWSGRLKESNVFPCTESNHNKIHSMYKKDKKNTQKMLRELTKRYQNEVLLGGRGV